MLYWKSGVMFAGDLLFSSVRFTLTKSSVLTVGVMADRLGVARHRVEYIIRSRGIEPLHWAGNARIFSEANLEYIASELARMDDEVASLSAARTS